MSVLKQTCFQRYAGTANPRICTLYRRYGSVSTILGSYRRYTAMPTILRGQHRQHATVPTIFSFIVGADAHRRSAQRRSIVNVHAERRLRNSDTVSSTYRHADDTASSAQHHPGDYGPYRHSEVIMTILYRHHNRMLTILRSTVSTMGLDLPY